MPWKNLIRPGLIFIPFVLGALFPAVGEYAFLIRWLLIVMFYMVCLQIKIRNLKPQKWHWYLLLANLGIGLGGYYLFHFAGNEQLALAAFYNDSGADELVYLDISATREERGTFTRLVERIADEINIPFTVGGGIGSVDDAARLLDAGADKISINSAAIASPSLIDRIASRYGSQFVVVAIDARCMEDGVWRATTHGGSRPTDKELFSWAREAQERGAGEILFTSMNHDGTRSGYPCGTFARLAEVLSIPVIASGGAGSVSDIAEVLIAGRADAALAASIFHYGEITIGDLKRQLKQKNINVRI